MSYENFKLIIVQTLFLFGQITSYAQSTSPTNTWLAGRHLGFDASNGNNIFGTRWNSGIYTITNNQFRMQLNGSINYPVNGFNGVRDGYLLIGRQMGNNYGAGNGAYSQLHLNGSNFVNNNMPSLGYRPWMQTGVTFTDNADLAYLGLRRVNNAIDLT